MIKVERDVCYTDKESTTIVMIYNMDVIRDLEGLKKKKKIWPTFPFLTIVVISSTIPFPLRKKYTSRNVFSSEG